MSVRTILPLVVVVILITASSAVDIGSDKPTAVGNVPDGLRKVEESFVQTLGQSRHVLSFARFTHRYGKMYQHAEEIKHRFSVFKENLDLIRSINKKGLSYKLGVNQFADLTWQEFQKNKIGAAQSRSTTLKGSHHLTERGLSETTTSGNSTAKDWREDGIVSPVRDQGNCGSSWAFSATGAVESAYHKKYYWLVDCADNHFGNDGCNGGFPTRAFQYIQSKGLILRKLYPYRGRDDRCRNNLLYPRVYVKRQVHIPSGAEDALKQAVGSIGPVSVGIGYTKSFRFYKSGVYTSSECNNQENEGLDVLAIGYGIENGVPYWLIKNSWGTIWGDKGYLKLEMGKNMYGVASWATYPVVA